MLEGNEIRTIYAQGPAAVAALIEALVATYEAELGPLRERSQALADQVAKESHTSHLPPSRDLPAKPKSLRPLSGRKPGGQPGPPGTTLAWRATPDAVVVHRPTTCAGCGATLGEQPVVGPVRRQVVEHRRCPRGGQVTQAAFPTDARGAVRYGPRLRGLAV